VLLEDGFATTIKAIELLSQIDSGEPLNYEAMLFTSLFQSGATHFYRLSDRDDLEDYEISSSYVNTKIETIDREYFESCKSRLFEAFSSCLPPEFCSEELIWKNYYEPVTTLIHFIATMMTAKEYGCTFLAMRMSKSALKFQEVLPEDLLQPINNFMNIIVQKETNTPVVAGGLDANGADIFIEILKSDMYGKYSSSFEEVEDGKSDIRKAVKRVSRPGSRLTRKHSNILLEERTRMSIISATSQLISTLAGSLPAKLFEIIGGQMTSEKRLVYYDASESSSALLERFSRASEILDPNWRKRIKPPHQKSK